MVKTVLLGLGAMCALMPLNTALVRAATTDVVMTASDATHLHGHWSRALDDTAAGGEMLASTDDGWADTTGANAAPTHYVEFTFTPDANTPYRVWLRLRAPGDSKYNDSVFVQFSDAVDETGAPVHRIGTSSALLVNLQPCDGCAHGWGWMDGAYWLPQNSTVTFTTSGSQTLRIQTREDGVQFDQIVLSPDTYLSSAPGASSSDSTVVARLPPAISTPQSGTPAAIPGIIEAEAFDDGAAGIAYHDTSSGNAGATYRDTHVDLEPATDGTYDIGWTAPGEWLNYTVDVAEAGTYDLEARVSSPGMGGTFHVDFGGRNVTGPLVIPDTGGWQNWTSVSTQVALTPGLQTMKLVFDTRGFSAVGNITSIRLTPHVPAPFGGVPATVPGSVRPEEFDTGGEGVSYHDTTAGNSGGQYREAPDRVDIENSAPYGHNVGWIADGEWLEYSVDVTSAGAYTLEVEVASPLSDGQMHARFGAFDTATVAIPNTGDWKQWTTVSVPVTLTAGVQIMRLAFDVGGFNVAAIHLTADATAPATTPTPAPEPIETPVEAVQPDPAAPAVLLVEAGGDLQAALDAARPGDTILVQAGATFIGNFVLPLKDGAGADGYITIRSSAADAALPDAATRITPAHAAYLPKLRSPNTQPALSTAAGAHHYRLQFLELLANVDGSGDILALGSGHADQNSLHLVPHDLVVDRVYIHGDVVVGQKRGIALNSASTSVLNSHISEIKAVGQDSQAIAGWNGPGPYLISNNYLEAAGENVMFGGADPAIPYLVPSDITFTRNHLSKPLAWRAENWSVKNLFELKSAQRVVIEGNLLENHWQQAQAGYAVLFKSVNQGGSAPWSVVQDVLFANNVVRHVSSGINILGRDASHAALEANHITIRNNLFTDVSGARYGGVGRFLLINGGVDITVDHNTVFNDGATTVYADGNPSAGFVFTNNIVLNNSWALKGSGTGNGNGTLATYFPNGLFLGGIFVGANPATYPAGNFYPATLGEVGLVDIDGGDYRVAAFSIYTNGATDGTDIGCHLDEVIAAMGTLSVW